MKLKNVIGILGISIGLLATTMGQTSSHAGMMKGNHKDMKMGKAGHAMINVPSIQCDMCKNNIETGMAKVPGIKSVEVNVEDKLAHFNYDPSVISENEIEDAITDLGYWANEKAANPKSYAGLMGCCQMPDSEYDTMMKGSKKMGSKGSMMKMMNHEQMKMDHSKPMGKMDHEKMQMRGHSEMKGDMMKHMDMQAGENTAMTMISLPTIQCESCQQRIESNLSKLDGIVEVKVDVDRKMGHVVYDPEKLTVASIESAIAKIGYQANEKVADAKAYNALPGCCQVP